MFKNSAYGEVLRVAEGDTSLLEGTHDILTAEVIHAVRHEMAQKLSDVIFRRLGIGTVGYPTRETLEHCATLMSAALGWDESRRAQEVAEVEALFEELRGVAV